MADDEFQIAQARPNIYDKVPGAQPMPPPSGPMNKTPNALPPAASKPGLFDDIPKKERHPMSDDDKRAAAQKRQDTITMDRFESSNIRPGSPEQWKDWARSLNIKNYQWATELDKWLQGRGFTGIMDPKLGPKEKKAVDDLLMESGAHWMEQSRHKHRSKPQGDTPPNDPKSDTFTPPGKKSELGDIPSAVSALGGRMMEEEDAA